MLVGSQATAAELEVAVDPAVGRAETLCMESRSEPLHRPFSSPRWLVRHLGKQPDNSDTWLDPPAASSTQNVRSPRRRSPAS